RGNEHRFLYQVGRTATPHPRGRNECDSRKRGERLSRRIPSSEDRQLHCRKLILVRCRTAQRRHQFRARSRPQSRRDRAALCPKCVSTLASFSSNCVLLSALLSCHFLLAETT